MFRYGIRLIINSFEFYCNWKGKKTHVNPLQIQEKCLPLHSLNGNKV